jgi:hypothetical protein
MRDPELNVRWLARAAAGARSAATSVATRVARGSRREVETLVRMPPDGSNRRATSNGGQPSEILWESA